MLKIAGDINFTDGAFDVGLGIGDSLVSGMNPFEKLDRKPDDLWIGNFEGVASDSSILSDLHAKRFIISPKHLTHFKHFNFYNVANNHSMEHGSDAYKKTYDFIQSVGAIPFGDNEQRSVCFEHQGKQVSITSFSQRYDTFGQDPLYWYNPEIVEVVDEYKRIPFGHFKIVYIHWGNEFINRPNNDQKRFAHVLVDIGFDLVVGMHPHILQGVEVFKGKKIFYSIGNFVFNMPWKPLHYGAIVNVDFNPSEPIVSYDYISIGKDYFPVIIAESDVPEKCKFSYLNKLLHVNENNEDYYKEVFEIVSKYRNSNWMNIIGNFLKFKYKPMQFFSIIIDFIKRKLS